MVNILGRKLPFYDDPNSHRKRLNCLTISRVHEFQAFKKAETEGISFKIVSWLLGWDFECFILPFFRSMALNFIKEVIDGKQ